MRIKFLALMCGISLLPLFGCGDGKIICDQHAGTYCEEGVTYWVDSCGDLEDVFEHCHDVCNAAHTGCLGGCTSQCTGKCCGSDGCGGTCPDNCSATGQICNQTSCQCEGGCNPQTCAQLGKECGQWDDGCGTQLTCGPCDAGETCDAAGQCQASNLPHFSFFITSLEMMRELSGSQDGFGGDLTYGETGPGAGLRGADLLCAEIAERSMPGSSVKQWRAFLSVTDDGTGNQVDAIDRIGEGPWYDRLGRLFANDKSELMYDRPLNADPVIKEDLPDEYGQPLHQFGDNHDVLTGSNAQGRLDGTSPVNTCYDWTSDDGAGTSRAVRCGHSWPARSGENWIMAHQVPGCAPCVNIVQSGGGQGTDCVGGAGGYGGIYCFALEP